MLFILDVFGRPRLTMPAVLFTCMAIFPRIRTGVPSMDMDEIEPLTLKQAVEESIAAAIERGALDVKANAAPIALLRRMAEVLDGNTDPLTMRYCTPASFTALFDKLGLLPTERQRERMHKPNEDGAFAKFQRDSRYSNLRESYALSKGHLDLSD